MTDFSSWLIKKRSWEFENLRFTNSAIAYDVLLCVYHLHEHDQNLAMKDVYRSLPYSESQVRSVIRMLESEGLLTTKSGHDRRRKSFSATTRLETLMSDYRKLMRECP